MSKLFSALLTLAVMGLLAASPARAAWTCIGPEHACSTTAQSKSLTKYASKSKASYAQKKKVKRTYSYSGGGSTGIASYYSQGTRTASGARFNPGGLTAAHRSLPFGTRVRVTNLSNGRSVTVTINDRGPFIKGRVIDLSRGAASIIGMIGSGVARVSYTVVGRG
jgi:rare lipoprotein A